VMQSCMMLADLDGMMRITEQLIVGMTQHLNATRIIPWKPMEQLLATAQRREYIKADADDTAELEVEFNLDDLMIDLIPPWSRRSVYELVQNMIGIDFSGIYHVGDAMDAARLAGVELQDSVRFKNVKDVLMETIKQVVGPSLIQPTFLIDFPSEESPFADEQRNQSKRGKHFELYINGLKFAEGFSGLTDPLEYETQQSLQSRQRADCSQGMSAQDDDFLTALKYGMPPFAGITVDIDRLVMLMTGAVDIRDVIYFPIFRQVK